MTVQSQLALSIATCGLTHFLKYATVNCILQTLSSVMIWVTTFFVCLEIIQNVLIQNPILYPSPPTMFNVFAVMKLSFTDIGLSPLLPLVRLAVCV